MAGASQVLVFDNEGGPDTPIAKALEALGVDYIPVCDTPCTTSPLDSANQPRAIVVNAASGRKLNDNASSSVNVADCMASLAHLATISRIPLILLARSEEEAFDIKSVAPWDDVLIGTVSPSQLAKRIATLARLGTMQTELARRMETAARYGVDAPQQVSPPIRVDDAAILVLGQGKHFARIESTLSQHATLTGAFSADTALDYLLTNGFDAVLVEIENNHDDALGFVEDVRRHPRFFNLPMIAIGSPLHKPWIETAYEAGFAEVFSDVDIAGDFTERTMNLVREGRYRESMRSIYRKARHMATSDALTGLYSRGFLFEHLKTMIRESGDITDAFTVATFTIQDMAELNDAYGYITGDRMIRQVGDMLGLLLRGEDLSARYSGARFAAVLPDTAPKDAEVAVNRIVSVIRQTVFSVPEIQNSIQIDIASGLAGYRAGDDPHSLISRSIAWNNP